MFVERCLYLLVFKVVCEHTYVFVSVFCVFVCARVFVCVCVCVCVCLTERERGKIGGED